MSERPASESRLGWPVIFGSALMAGTGSGLYQNFSSLFLPAVQEVTGASRGTIGTAAGFGLLGALAAPFIGRVADRIGVVRVIGASGIVIAGALLWLSAMSGPLWQFQVGVALLALGAPGYSALIYGRLIARRFERHRGLAMGLATSGLSLVTVIMPVPMAWVLAEWGWRAGYWLLAGLAIGIGLPLGIYATYKAGALEPPPPRERPVEPPGWRDRLFWRLVFATMFINIGTFGMVTQLAPIGQERGLGLAQAGLLVSAYGLSQIVGRLTMGALIDRYPFNRIAAVFGLISTAGFAALLMAPPSVWFVAAAVFVAGLLNGADYDLTPYLVSRLFPLPVYGEIFGRISLFSILSGGIGLAGFGLLHDLTGNYSAPLAMGAVTMILAAVLLYGLPAHRHRGDMPSVPSPDKA